MKVPHRRKVPTLAPSLVRLRREIDTRWPGRTKAPGYQAGQDAWLGDAAHARRLSGHNPDPRNMVHAMDVAVAGINVRELLGRVIGDPRVWYVIYNHTIYSLTNHWRPVPYTGADPHTEHVHVSLQAVGGGQAEGHKSLPWKVWHTAEQGVTGWGLASLVHPRMVVKYVLRRVA